MTLPHDVRRAERCIGLAVRKGQAEGRIARQGQGGGNPPRSKRDRVDSGISLPTQFATPAELHGNEAGIYHLTDNVTDEEFEKAVEVSR